MNDYIYITLRLSRRQEEKLVDVIYNARDEGPSGEGWASTELSELRDLVDAAIELAKS